MKQKRGGPGTEVPSPPLSFPFRLPGQDAAGLKASCGSERLAPDLFTVFIHRYMFIIPGGHAKIKRGKPTIFTQVVNSIFS